MKIGLYYSPAEWGGTKFDDEAAYDEHFLEPGEERVDLIGRFAEIGVARIVCFPTKLDPTVEAQARFAEDCVAAGIALHTS